MSDSSTRILLVEHNAGDARMIGKLLADSGDGRFTLERADGLASALQRLDRGGNRRRTSHRQAHRGAPRRPGLGQGEHRRGSHILLRSAMFWTDGMMDRNAIGCPVTDELAKPASRRVPGAEHADRGTETILLVEDEDILRRAGRRLLERFGYTVITAADGEEAFERWRPPE